MAENKITYVFKLERDLKKLLLRVCQADTVYPLEMRTGGTFGLPDLMIVEPSANTPAQITFVELKLVDFQGQKLRWTKNQLPIIYRLLDQGVRVLVLEGVKGTNLIQLTDCYFSTYITGTADDLVSIGAFISNAEYAKGQNQKPAP